MSLLGRWESWLGRYAVTNIMTIVIAGELTVYLLHLLQDAGNRMLKAPVLELVQLNSEKVLDGGEWWRVLTFLFNPETLNPFFLLIAWSAMYFVGGVLEQVWGAARVNLYLLIGYLASIAAALLPPLLGGGDMIVTNWFFYSSLFLAFANLFPDYKFSVYFILPIKAKWLAMFQWGLYLFVLAGGTWADRWMVLAVILSYLIFFTRSNIHGVQRKFRREAFLRKAKPIAIVHTCRVCGASSKDNPRMAFRYCSQCEGQNCYCPQHIRSHEHVTK